MTDDDHCDPIFFLEQDPPSRFERRVVTVAPGQARRYDATEWDDAIVMVERGEIELEALSGRRVRFERGDLLWLVGLPLRALHNPGNATATLVAISRRR